MQAMDRLRKDSADWVNICPLDQLVPEVGICALVGNRHVAVFYLPDEQEQTLYAIDNIDPFSNASVLSRGIVGDVKGELVVASPIYKQHFSLKDGRCLEDETVRLTVFEVQVTQGIVQVWEVL
jgi:NAD(P)H-dependent nitrite reductase small subunit